CRNAQARQSQLFLACRAGRHQRRLSRLPSRVPRPPFLLNARPTPERDTLSLHDALPIFEPRNGFLLRENQNRALCFLPRIHESVKSEENFFVSRRGVWLVDGNIGTSHQRCLSQRRNRPNRSVQAQIKNQSRYMGIIDSYLAIRRDEWNCGFRKRLG